MKQLFLMVNDGTVKHIESPIPTVKDNHVIVETLYSAVSAGTERGLTNFGGKNLIQKAFERPDQVKMVIEKMATDGILTTIDSAFIKLKDPMPIGYSGVGKVLEVGKGVTGIFKGDLVAMAGQAYHSEVNRVNKNLVVKVPDSIKDYRQTAFCALGGIALQAIHQAKVEPGESVAVIGLGLLGHITARILDAYGCDVVGYDVKDKTLEQTQLKGFILSDAENAEENTKSLTNGRGVDKVIITAAANSNDPMDLAAAIVRDRGIICMVGVTKMNIDRRPYYDKELTFTVARSYGPGRYEPNYEEKGIDYPIGHIRFTQGRNLEEFIRLISEQKVDFSDLISHEIAFDKAEKAYELITTNSKNENYIGILLTYSEDKNKITDIIHHVKKQMPVKSELINVGLIGAGNFVRNTLLPSMVKTKHFNLKGLATTGGIGASQVKSNYEFDYITNDYNHLFEDDAINLIVISTQHNTHAKLIIEALKKNKHVYCEKPMCLNLDELNKIKEAYNHSKGELFIGLNRRHAPLIQDIKNKLGGSQALKVYEYTVNAGHIFNDHWTQDEEIGGGRIIGEAIHFVDLIQNIEQSEIKSISIAFANNLANNQNDNAIISIKFSSGSIGNITYTSVGSKKFPKEYLRIFTNGEVYEMDNYIKLREYGKYKKRRFKLKQDKGVFNQYKHIFRVLNTLDKNPEIHNTFNNHEQLIKALDNVIR